MAERKGRDLDRDPDTGQPEDHLGGVAGGAFAGGTAGGSRARRWQVRRPARSPVDRSAP